MARIPTRLVAVVLVAGATVIVGSTALATPGVSTPDDTPTSNESAATGAFVSSVVGQEEAAVDASIQIARLDTQLSDAATDRDRAETVDRFLTQSQRRIRTLETRMDALDARRANGSITRGEYAVRMSWLRASTEGQARLLGRLEGAAQKLPESQRAEHGLTSERFGRLDERVDGLLARDVPRIHRTTFDRQFYRDVAALAETYNQRGMGDNLGVFGRQLSGERVNLYVEADDGRDAVISFRMTENREITELRAGKRTDATVRVLTDEGTARQIVGTDTSGRAAAEAFVDGEIRVEGLGFFGSIIWLVRTAVLAVARFLIAVAGGVGHLL